MKVHSFNAVFQYFKQYNFDEVYQAIGLKREHADWLFHIIHNDFDEKDLAQKFGIDQHEALAFIKHMEGRLEELMQAMNEKEKR